MLPTCRKGCCSSCSAEGRCRGSWVSMASTKAAQGPLREGGMGLTCPAAMAFLMACLSLPEKGRWPADRDCCHAQAMWVLS